MANQVASTIIVNIKANVDGQSAVDTFTKSLANLVGASKVTGASVGGVASAGTSLFSSFAKALLVVKGLATSFDLLSQSASLAFQAIKAGLSFDADIENARLRLGSLINYVSTITKDGQTLTGVEAFKAAETIALSYFSKIQAASILTGAPVNSLVNAFEETISAATRAKLTLQQTLDIITLSARAAASLNIPIEKLGTELRGLLSASLTKKAPLAIALFGDSTTANAQVKALIKSGELFDALKTKLTVWATTGDETSKTFAGLLNQTQQLALFLESLTVSPLFESIKTFLNDTLKSIRTIDTDGVQHITPGAQKILDLISDIVRQLVGQGVSVTKQIVAYVSQLVKYLTENHDYLIQITNDLQNIAKQLALILFDIFGIAGDMERARASSSSWHEILLGVSVALGPIRDVLNFIVGALETVAGIVLEGILYPVQIILKVGSLLSHQFDAAHDSIVRARQALHDFATEGAVRAASGIDATATGEALNNRVPVVPKPKTATTDNASDLTATPNLAAVDDPASLAKLIAVGKQVDAALHALFVSFGNAAKAETADLAALAQGQIVDELDALKQQLADKLVSLKDYYAKKQELEDEANDVEVTKLSDDFKFEQKIIEDKIQSIKQQFEGFSLTTNEGTTVTVPGSLSDPHNQDAEIQSLLRKEEELKIRTLTNELTVKQVDYQTALVALNAKQVKGTQDNNQALFLGNQLLSKQSADIQAELLAAQGRTSDAAGIGIGEKAKEQFKAAIAESGLSPDVIKAVIEDVNTFATLSTNQITTILDDAGVKFKDLSNEVKAVILLTGQLEKANVFKGLQTVVSTQQAIVGVQVEQIQDQINQGVIREYDGRHKIALIEQASKAQLEQILLKMLEIHGATAIEAGALGKLPIADLAAKLATIGFTPEQIQTVVAFRQQLDESGREADILGNKINDVVGNDIGSFFDALATGTQSIADDFRQLISGLLADIAKAILQAVVLKGILDALGLNKQGESGSGSAGGIGGFLSGLIGGLFGGGGGGGGEAEGGLQTGPGTGTSDSLIRRLSNGEWVIPAARVVQYGHSFFQDITRGTFGRNIAGMSFGGLVGSVAQSAGASVALRNVNLLDPELLTGQLNSAHGERVLFNFISKNPQKIRRALGLGK